MSYRDANGVIKYPHGCIFPTSTSVYENGNNFRRSLYSLRLPVINMGDRHFQASVIASIIYDAYSTPGPFTPIADLCLEDTL